MKKNRTSCRYFCNASKNHDACDLFEGAIWMVGFSENATNERDAGLRIGTRDLKGGGELLDHPRWCWSVLKSESWVR